jgi:hypothetical protein
MPVSKTKICNMALGHIGVNSSIGNVETENTPEAAVCRLYYDQALDLLLESRIWSWCKRQVALAVLTDPPDDWGYRYKYPNFCRLAGRIVNPYDRTPIENRKIPFEIRDQDDGVGKVILTDQPDAILEYNHDLNDTNLFTATFVEALSQTLASKIAMSLRVDMQIVSSIKKEALYWVEEASELNFSEAQEDPQPVSEFQTVRS